MVLPIHPKFFLHALQFSVTLSLTRKSNPAMVKWTPECVAAFDDLKKCLCNDPLLCPHFELPFTVSTVEKKALAVKWASDTFKYYLICLC